MRCQAALRVCKPIILAAALNGCVLSVDPVVTETDATFDPRLIGTWSNSASEFAVVTQAGELSYAIEYTLDERTGRLAGRLGRLGNRTILDVWPEPQEGELPQPYDGLMVAGHLVLALDIETDEITASVIKPDSVIAGVTAGRVDLDYRETERAQLILLDKTESLRSALGAFLTRPSALDPPTVWRRVAASESATAPPPRHGDQPCFGASAWPEADSLFHSDPHWVGADGASSVILSDDRILWLFGDSWIDPSGMDTRRGAHMVSNTVAIQTGTDPTTASISFHWGEADDGSPTAFFPDRGAELLWPGDGVRVDDRLVVFLARTVRGGGGALGFRSPGWTAVIVENPDDEPPAWRIRSLETPANPLGVLVGFATVLELDGYVYAIGPQDPVKTHPVFAVRWPRERVLDADLLDPEWWAGERLGWVPDSSSAPRWPLFENGASEMTIHWDRASRRFLAVQTEGFGSADVVIRDAPALVGPWSATQLMYRPPEYGRASVMIYSGKAHPHLTGGDLVLTYSTNTFSFAEQLKDGSIYYPRFVRLSRCGTE